MAGKRGKPVRARSAPKKNISVKTESQPKIRQASLPTESLEQLTHQREEIQALLSSLEDAYSEASILEADYDDIKSKNEKKLDEINRKIEAISKAQAAASTVIPEEDVQEKPIRQPVKIVRPKVEIPVIEDVEEELPPAAEKAKGKKEKEKAAALGISQDDLQKMQMDLADSIRKMVEEIGSKVTDKDMTEMRNSFAKLDAEIDKMKAQLEAVKESRKIDDDKIQRVVEGLAEVRTMVYGREASTKEQEIKMEKMIDLLSKLEPEKLLLEIGRRDKEISNQALRVNKLEETSKEFGEMLKRIETLLRNIGSLEHVIKIGTEASEKLMEMQDMQRSVQKMSDKIQGMYAELSKRMEEFMLYRAKQDRVDDMLNDVLKNLDELNTKAAYFVTRDDLESFRSSVQATISSAASYAPAAASDERESQKEEIKMLLKTLEDELKSKSISKGEYEKMRNANLAKLKELDNKAAPKATQTIKEPVPAKPVKVEKKEPVFTKDQKNRNDMLLKDLEETFRKGMISKEAYDKTRKMILGKR
ncbi:MAG: hypothetical protein NTU57_01165 [Candidatus Aenigmarchaeota archaeon]|nr:hypothetical protein [Candidatus Aenigmarchaeota archaeon]